MTTAATITARLTLDTSDYDDGISDAKKKAAGFSNKMKSVGGKLAKTGGLLTAGVTVPILGAGAALVNLASDAEESANALNVVFGDAAAGVLDFSKDAATAVGLTTTEFNQLAAESGALLKNVGFSADEAGEEVIRLGTRAADMASIFNTDVDQALAAIQSGLKGEFNPLEQFGVKMNQAMIDAKALAMGLGEVTVSQAKLDAALLKTEKATAVYAEAVKEHGENSEEAREASIALALAQESLEKVMAGQTKPLSDNAKATAALALLYEQTDQFAGDFANTSDGVANSTKILKSQISDAGAALGVQLLPFVKQGIQFLSGLVSKFQALTPEQQKMILMVMGIVAVLPPLITILGGVVSAIGAVAGASLAVVAPIAAIIAIVALLAAAWKNNWGGIREKTAAAWDKIKPVLEALGAWFKEKIPQAFAAVVDFWNTKLKPVLVGIWNALQPVFKLIGALVKLIVANWVAAFRLVSAVIKNVVIPIFKEVVGWFEEHILPIFEAVVGWVADKLSPAFETLGGWISSLADWLSDLADSLLNLDLPDWLTPGSPTPLEMGVVGINDAMQDLSNQGLSDMDAGLGMTLGGDLDGGGGLTSAPINVSVTINGNATEADVRNGVSLGVTDALRKTGLA
jgi:phage-related minor tail protein